MIVCPTCGEENPDRARFCLACAEPLAAPAPAGEERKVVSVLFVDLVGFTDRSDRADPEDVRATLRPYHERVKVDIERHGGTVEKFIGDAVMAVFGAPVAHEDDAERAVRSALQDPRDDRGPAGGGPRGRGSCGRDDGRGRRRARRSARARRGDGRRRCREHRRAAAERRCGWNGHRRRDDDALGRRRDRLRAAGAGRREGEVGADRGLARLGARSRVGQPEAATRTAFVGASTSVRSCSKRSFAQSASLRCNSSPSSASRGSERAGS